MNAVAEPTPTLAREIATLDWCNLIDFIDRWNIAECVTNIRRSRYGFSHEVTLAAIEDIERAFAGTGLHMRLFLGSGSHFTIHALIEVDGVCVGACGSPRGRSAGEVTL